MKYIDFYYFTCNLHFVKDFYYQLDTVQYENQDSDKKYLEKIVTFLFE